jgi:hypothetical protein
MRKAQAKGCVPNSAVDLYFGPKIPLPAGLAGALVAFGSVVTIEPGVGALAFCAVVILTMFAAETFDPRLMWDAAAEREPAAIQADPGLAASD